MVFFWPKKQPVTTPISEVTVTPQLKKCPVGFILVPGSQLLKTGDFCVMKYDAKCTDKSDLSSGLEPLPGSGCTNEGTYKNNGPGCSCSGDKQIVSTSSGFPVTYLPETMAKSYCEKQGWHLLTNPEWMTIARNAETVPDNWCDGNGTNCGNKPGSPGKILANGHNNGNSTALTAGEDNQPCYKTAAACGEKGSQKRTLTLSNGEVIWDLAGNVWQWIDIEVERRDQPQSQTGGKPDTGWKWSEFAPGGLQTVITDNGRGTALGYDSFRPTNPTWNSTNGVGRIYHYSSPGDNNTTLYTFIRGGNWRHGYDSGAFTVHMGPTANTENIDDVGFRCAYFL